MVRKLRYIVAVSLLVLFSLYLAVTVPISTATSLIDTHSEDFPYAARGPYTIGIHEAVIEAYNGLPITLWYPAFNESNHQETTTYSYPIKLGDPLGMVTVATYEGHAIKDAKYDTSAAPYPLVILSPGFSMGATAYGWIAEHLASYGFVVIAPEHQEHFDGELNGLWQSLMTRPQDIQTVLDYVDEQVVANGVFEGLIDADSVAVVGHSYGGYTTLAAAGAQIDTAYLQQHCQEAHESEHPAAWLCDEIVPHLGDMAALAGLDTVPERLWHLPTDPRIDAIVPLAGDAYLFGQSGLAQITVPALAIGGTSDQDTPYDWGTQPTYDHVSSTSRIQIGLIGAEHMIFTGSCGAIPLLLRFISDEFCSDGDWNRYHAHNIVKHFATAFLLVELQFDLDAGNVLVSDYGNLSEMTYRVQGY